MKRCPGCSVRLGPVRLLFQTKYFQFACFSCGATLARDFSGAAWIVVVGVILGVAGLVAECATGCSNPGPYPLIAVGPFIAVGMARLFLPLRVIEPPV
jgi:ribosomal protein S27E